MIATIETTCKTSKQIELDYKSIVDQFDIMKKIKSVVTDSANANKSAFKHRADMQWYPCEAHNLNIVLKHSFAIESKDDDYKSISDIDSLIKYCKHLVAYCKHSGWNSKLHPSLKQTVETRWDSTLECLESIRVSYDQIKAFCNDSEDLKKYLLPINISLLQEVINILVPFRTARQKLCRNSDPTFHEVAVIKQCLLTDHLKPIESDLSTIKSLKKRLSKNLCDKFSITVDHIIASYLTPGLKNNFLSKFHDQQLVTSSREYLKSICDEIAGDDPDDSQPIPMKKTKSDDLLASYYTTTSVPIRYKLNEIEGYRVMPVTDQDRDHSPILFWHRNSEAYPKLSKIAMSLIPIPATSVKSEQNFSAAGLIFSDRRSKLNSDTVDTLLFIKSNMSSMIL